MANTQAPSGDAIAKEPITISYPNGRIVRSFSLIDRGINPLKYFSPEQNVYRAELGDIRFIVNYDRDRKLKKLLFVPEYPSEEYRQMREYLTFYGILLSRPAEESSAIYQLRAWDINYRPIKWEEGIKLLAELDVKGLTLFQREIVQNIRSIEELLTAKTPNVSLAEMRKAVGSATGGRLELKALVMS